jgi:hypothetical protein
MARTATAAYLEAASDGRARSVDVG